MAGMAFPITRRAWTEYGPWPATECPAVYTLVPPMLTVTGVSDFVIVAANSSMHVVEVFAADDSGLIEEWEPLAVFPGSDHARVLKSCGYEVVVVDA